MELGEEQNTHFTGTVGTFLEVRTFCLVLTTSRGCLKTGFKVWFRIKARVRRLVAMVRVYIMVRTQR